MNIIAIIAVLVALDPITFGDTYDAYTRPSRGTRRDNTDRAIARKRRAGKEALCSLRFDGNHIRTKTCLPEFDEEKKFHKWDTYEFNCRKYDYDLENSRKNIGNTSKTKSHKERKALQACNSKLKDF